MGVSHKLPYGSLIHLGTANRLSKSADFSEYDNREIGHVRRLGVILHVHSADRTNINETYDVYLTSRLKIGGQVFEWDVIHFPQIATTGEKIYHSVVELQSGVGGPNRVTTAVPGASSMESGTIKIDTAGADQGVKTLAAGTVRHGYLGQELGHYLVVAGTTPGPFVYSIYVYAL